MKGRWQVGNQILIWLALLGLSATACRQPQSVRAPEEPIRGGTLVIGLEGLGEHLNPGIDGRGAVVRSTQLIYQGLLYLDEDLVAQPELAESFEVEEGGKVYRFNLREGVLWHDGKPFTSSDVKFTFERVLFEFHPRVRSLLKSKIEAIETPDSRTVVFRLTQPFSAFLALMTMADTPILPRHVFEGEDLETHPANVKPVGTGPFRFVSLSPDSELRLERNPDFFRVGLPYLDSLIYRVIPDSATLLIALEKGEVDVVREIQEPNPDLDRLRNDPRFGVVATPGDSTSGECTDFLGFNLDRPMFRDVRFRRAIAHGLDRNRMLDEVLFGYGRVADAPINSGISWAHADDLDYPGFDQKEAAELLDGVGWVKGPNGKRVARGVPGIADGSPLRFEVISHSERKKLAEIMRAQLQPLGVEVIPAAMDKNLAIVRVYEQRDFDTFIEGPCQRTDPEIGLRRIIHSSEIVPIDNSNGAGYRNSEVDTLLDQAASELDREVRARLYLRLQRVLVQDLPYVWLIENDRVRVFSKSCAGFDFESIHLAERAYCVR